MHIKEGTRMSTSKVTFFISLTMIVTAIFGVVLLQTKSDFSLPYLEALCVFFAFLCVFLGCYHRKIKKKETLSTVFHELFHWLGLLCVVVIISRLVSIGAFSRYASSLMVLLLLAFSTFVAGVYVEFVLMIVGAILALSTLVLAFFNEYLYSVFIPALLVIAAIWFFAIRLTRQKKGG